MKKIVRYLVKKACATLLDDCYIIITCSKRVDKTSQPIHWHINTNLALVSDAKIVCDFALSKLQTEVSQREAIEEVNNILTLNK